MNIQAVVLCGVLTLVTCRVFAADIYRITETGFLEGQARSIAIDMNASGQIVGSQTHFHGGGPAWLWDGTTMVDLGSLRGTTSLG